MNLKRRIGIVLLIAGIMTGQRGKLFGEACIGGDISAQGWMISFDDQYRFSQFVSSHLNLEASAMDWDAECEMNLRIRSQYISGMTTNPEWSFSVSKMYIRYYAPFFDLTAGKTVLSLGQPVIFNPFEMNKNISFQNLENSSEGILALMILIPVGMMNELKWYVSPSQDLTNSKTGLEFRTYLPFVDAGAVLNRKGTNRNIAGVYLKKDLLLGWNASAAYHFENMKDEQTNTYYEISAGADYSLLGNKIQLSAQYYHCSAGAEGTNDYFSADLPEDRYLNAENYLYSHTAYAHDEFLSTAADWLWNINDGSSVLIPSLKWNLSSGLSADILGSVTLGDDSQEFSEDLLGKWNVMLNIKAEF